MTRHARQSTAGKRPEQHKHTDAHVGPQAAEAQSPVSAVAEQSAKPVAPTTRKPIGERLRSLFARKPKEGKEARAGKTPAEDLVAQKLRAAQKKRRPKLTRQSLQQYLDKAGYNINAERAKKITFQTVVGVFFLLTAIVLTVAAVNGAKAGNVLLFVLGLWTAVFAGTLLLVWAAVYFYLDYRIYKRTRELEEVLPDFLQLASSNIAAGMPIDRALWYAIRPNFGVLAKEMEEVAKATMAGEDLETSLVRFTDKYDSVMLKRSINILIEGLHAGGEMADLLNKIALNIEEMKIMKKEMAASVTTYAIFITFASVVIAPFLFALATELLIIIIKITGTLNLDGGSMLTLAKPDPAAVENFKTFSIFMLIVSTIFSACLVSVIKRGNVMEGIKTIPVYALIAIFIYWIASIALHSMFGGII